MGFVLASAFSLFSQAGLFWQNSFQGKDAMSKKPVPFLWEWNTISLLSQKKTTCSRKHERGKPIIIMLRGTILKLLAILHVLQTHVFCHLGKGMDSN